MSKNIAIIGAGLSGAILYESLKDKNHKVTVFEKSRGAGGRCSTRYIDDLKIDHGTSNFQVKDLAFKEFCDTQVKAGNLLKEQGFYKGVNGINQMVSSHISNEDIVNKTRITTAYKNDSKWILEDEDENIYTNFDIVLCTIPTPQILDLQIESIEAIKEELKSVAYDSVATLITHGIILSKEDIKNLEQNSFFRKISVQKDGIVFHTNSFISNEVDSKEEVKNLILQEIISSIGRGLSDSRNLIPHLWRYGFVTNSLDKEYIYDQELKFGVCGDYFKGDNLESSFLSSKALADTI